MDGYMGESYPDMSSVRQFEQQFRDQARQQFDNSDRPWEGREEKLLWWQRIGSGTKSSWPIFLIVAAPIAYLVFLATR